MYRGMTLDQYMKAKGLSDEAMAAMIGGVSAGGVGKWRRGERLPRLGEMSKIVKATDGKVLPNDFYGVKTPRPARKSEAA